MRRHTPDAFDTAVQKANIWLKEIEQAGKLRSRFQAYAALRSVLHALRDCLPPAEAVKFSAQMPLLVKGVFFDGWKVSPKPMRMTHAEFNIYIRHGLKEEGGVEPEIALKAVLSALSRHISPSVLDTLEPVLPREVHAVVHATLAGIRAEKVVGLAVAPNDIMSPDLGGPFGE